MVVVFIALAVVVLTFAVLNRTTYKPGRDNMAPPTTRHTHKLLKQLERTPDGQGPERRWEIR